MSTFHWGLSVFTFLVLQLVTWSDPCQEVMIIKKNICVKLIIHPKLSAPEHRIFFFWGGVCYNVLLAAFLLLFFPLYLILLLCLWVSLTLRESVKPGDYWKTLHLSYPDSCCPSATGLSKLCVYLFPLHPCALCFHFHWIECPGTFLSPGNLCLIPHASNQIFIYFLYLFWAPLFLPSCVHFFWRMLL